MKMIEVLVCDDHQIFRDGIKATLEGDSNVKITAEASNGIQCLELLKTHVPDVILLDISMPEMDGIQCLQEIKAKYPFIKVIALTQFDEKRFVTQMMKYGADGYILKSTSKRELLIALSTVMQNRQYISETIESQSKTPSEVVPVDQLFPSLTHREQEIIKLLCHEASTKQIADQLNISVSTIETHRSNIFKKLGVVNIAGLVRWAVNNEFD